MSYVVAATDLLQAAGADLASIHSVLVDASSAVAGPTIGIVPAAADEVSGTLAALFGDLGRQYQVLSAQAQTFHARFAAMMNSGAGAYLSAEIANAEQAIASAVRAPVQSLLTSGLFGGVAGSAESTGLLGGLVGSSGVGATVGGVLGSVTAGTGISTGLGGVGATVGGVLGSVTGGTGLSGVGATVSSVVGGLTGGSSGLGGVFGSLTGGAVNLGALGNLGSELGSLGGGLNGVVSSVSSTLASLGTVGSLTAVMNSVPGLAGTVGNLGSLGANLQNSLAALLPALPSSLSGVEHSLSGLVNSLLPNLVNVDLGNAGPAFTGLFGPYQELSYNTFTNLQALGADWAANPFPLLRQFVANQAGYGHTILTALQTGDFAPVSAIPDKIATNFGNVTHTLSDLSVKTTLGVLGAGAPVTLNNMIGLPLVAGAAVIGPPAAAAQAAWNSASAFAAAVQAGNGTAAFAAAFGAPAEILNGFLNGHAAVPYTLDLTQILSPLRLLLTAQGFAGIANLTAVANLPLDGLLVQPGYYPLTITGTTALAPLVPATIINAGVGGTPFSGLLPFLINYAPQQLAVAIGAPTNPAPLISIPITY